MLPRFPLYENKMDGQQENRHIYKNSTQTHTQVSNCRHHKCAGYRYMYVVGRDLRVRQVRFLESRRDFMTTSPLRYYKIYSPSFLLSLPLPLKYQHHSPLFLPESAHHSSLRLAAFFICHSSHPHLLFPIMQFPASLLTLLYITLSFSPSALSLK